MLFRSQINTLTVQFQDYYEYGQQAVRWKATWDHYYQQVARFIARVRNPLLSNKVDFREVPLGTCEKMDGSLKAFTGVNPKKKT